jgi:ABC-2 type transport system permease protein
MSDVFYWPVVDLLLFGLTSVYFRNISPGNSNIVYVVICGILFWTIVWRGQYEISVNILEEIWTHHNLVNLFVSPLTFSEWISSLLLIGLIKAIIGFAFASLIAFILYQVKIFIFGFYILLFFPLLILTGWWVGFLMSGLILRYGTKIQTFAWIGIMIISPFSGIYYPLSILPAWARTISAFIPTSYLFEGIREVIYTGSLDIKKVIINLILNIIYLTLSLIFIKKSFQAALKKGLLKVY